MRKLLVISSLLILTALTALGQRKVTPVEGSTTTVTTTEEKKAIDELLKKKIRPSLVFSDTIFDIEREALGDDTLPKPEYAYPKLHSISFGANIWDLALKAFGQKYGLIDFSIDLSIHNRFFPRVEIGLGRANDHTDDANFHYRSPLSVFGRIGGSYNFLYRGDERYRLYAGFMAGFSSFKYDITDATVKDGYWNESSTFDITGIKSHAFWGEVMLGIRVGIWRNLSMGWSARYRFMFSCKNAENARPWYIPGFGPRNTTFCGEFSIYYTLPLGPKPKP